MRRFGDGPTREAWCPSSVRLSLSPDVTVKYQKGCSDSSYVFTVRVSMAERAVGTLSSKRKDRLAADPSPPFLASPFHEVWHAQAQGSRCAGRPRQLPIPAWFKPEAFEPGCWLCAADLRPAEDLAVAGLTALDAPPPAGRQVGGTAGQTGPGTRQPG
jgi:hypothetical protein